MTRPTILSSRFGARRLSARRRLPWVSLRITRWWCRALVPAIALLGASAAAETIGQQLPRSTPEAMGVDSSGLLRLVEALEQRIDAVHSLMVVRHGHVVADAYWAPYRREDPHVLYSLTKSVTSSAVGFAAQEGLLHVNDTVLSHFPDLAPKSPDDNLRKMRIRDLLRMATGHQDDIMALLREAGDSRWVRGFLRTAVPHRPGTHFRYNSAASYMLAAIVQRVSGQTVEQYLQPRLFAPLGIRHQFWGKSEEGINLGAGGLMMRTEDIAKFGQLYLQRGKWQGQQLLSNSWVEAATSLQIATGSDPDSNWDHGYGYQFWRNKVHGYRADGAQGQFAMVLPYYDTVVAITSGTSDMAGIMDAVWHHLLPALGPQPLTANAAAHNALTQRLRGLQLPTQSGKVSSPLASRWSGKRFEFPRNEQGLQSAQVDISPTGLTLNLVDADGSHPIDCGLGRWQTGTTRYKPELSHVMRVSEQGLAASCGWAEPDVLAVKLCFNQTPYTIEAQLHFEDKQLRVEMQHNLRWGPTQRKPLVGKLAVSPR